MLSGLPPQARFPNLLVGVETGDDSAVYKINDTQAVVVSTDFFMPIVDDPYDFGRIAAANAVSDIYATGGTPILALAIAGFPANVMPTEMATQIFAGGADLCGEANIPVAGGHTIDSPEPIYGLAVVGLVHPDRIMRNCDSKAGDVLILGKGLGVGILGAALNKDELDPKGYEVMVESCVKLNSVGADLAQLDGVNAITDVTGFGLGGHLYEMCKGSGLGARLSWDKLPLLDGAADYAQKGYNTGAANRNWESFIDHVTVFDGIEQWQKNLLMDPQTSGGLMISCDAGSVDEVLALFKKQGYGYASVVGEMHEGDARVTVEG
jgi:selenide,water dikinase